MKRCGNCGQAKPVTEFHRRGRGLQTWCKKCRREYDARYHRATRRKRVAQKKLRHAELVAWYQALKSRVPCADCGGMFHHAAMTWDHLPGATKVADVSSLLQRHNRKLILAEIAKCELVCANCHAVRTFQRRRDVAQPG
jgi:formate dehydrogenase assembly factor FdhD